MIKPSDWNANLAAPGQPLTGRARLLRAMSSKAKDARFASLAALPPYSETKSADGQTGGFRNDFGAFQSDAYQDDAYQVF